MAGVPRATLATNTGNPERRVVDRLLIGDPVKLLLTSDATLQHVHDVTFGPESRDHSHTLILSLVIEHSPFEVIYEPTVRKLWADLVAEIDGKHLRDIQGIKPTFTSLALNLAERARSQVAAPSNAVRIACPDEGWEIRTA